MPNTLIDRARLKELAALCTALPWDSTGLVQAFKGTTVLIATGGYYIARLFTEDGPTGANSLAPKESLENANYIVAACNAVPGLLEELEAKERLLRKVLNTKSWDFEAIRRMAMEIKEALHA